MIHVQVSCHLTFCKEFFGEKRPPYWNAIFWPCLKKKEEQKIPNNLTSYFSFSRSRFLSRSTVWMPEIAYISSYRYSLYKRTSYLSETGSWDFDWQVSRTCERNDLWPCWGKLNHFCYWRRSQDTCSIYDSLIYCSCVKQYCKKIN